MKYKLAFPALFMTVLLFSVLNGGGLYEEIIVSPVWSADLPSSLALIQQPSGLTLTDFWIPFHIGANIFLILALIFNWPSYKTRIYLLVVLGLYLLIRGATFTYFAPEIIDFEHTLASGMTDPELATRVERWITLSWVRTVAEVGIFILLLLAFVQPKGKSD